MATPTQNVVLRLSQTRSKIFPKYPLRVSLHTTPKLKTDEKVSHFVAVDQHRVFSGIQPTGIPHVGNYAGAIKEWVRLQNRYEGNMLLSVVDLHSITLPQDQKHLKENIFNMTACLLACGIDPNKTILFQQSMVPQHTELAWILGCLCTVARLNSLATWKDKKRHVREPNVGLLTYPILQAADILLYKSSLVPVGEDQTHHMSLVKDLAKAFNRVHGKLFPEPQMLLGDIPKIKSLRDPTKKMSKSDPMSRSKIDLLDAPDVVIENIKKAKTDFTSELTYDPINRPGVANLIEIHMCVTDMTEDEIVEESYLLAEDTGMYKLRMAALVADKLAPIRAKVLALQKDPGTLEDILHEGAKKASEIAESTMEEVRLLVGFR